ncbi:type II secretion system F family protein [Rugamonas sp. A1-17]|nr:type II secretion system F family protein [Rugamonas sp. A1-17]
MNLIEKLNQFKERRRLAIKPQDRIMWYGAMASVGAVQISMHQALTDMEPNFRETKHPMHPVVTMLLFRMRGGGEDNPDVKKRTIGTELMSIVPREEAMLIQAGEQTARISEGFSNAAQMVNAKSEMTAKVWALMRKPIGLVALMLAMFIFFRMQVIPSFEASHPRATWPTHARALGWTTDHIFAIGVLVTIVICIIAFVFTYVLPRWASPRREALDRYFPLNLVASLNGVSFLKSLAAYTGAGLPAAVSIPAIGASGTPYMKWQCEKISALMRNGIRLEDALARLSIIPRRFHWIIAVYSKLKDASLAYNEMAKSMTIEVTTTLEVYFGHIFGNIMFWSVTGSMFFVWSTFFGIATARA